MKNPEFIPLDEDQQEEYARLNANKKKFVPIEEVPNIADETPELTEEEKQIVNMTESENYTRVFDTTHRSVIEKHIGEEEEFFLNDTVEAEHNKNLTNQPLHFRQEESVASIGPDVEEESIRIEELKTEIEKGSAPHISRRKTDEPISSMAPTMVTSRSRSHSAVKKSIRHIFTRGTTENMKTVPENKKQRMFRGVLRQWLGLQNDQKTNQHKKEQSFEQYEPEEIENSPKEANLRRMISQKDNEERGSA